MSYSDLLGAAAASSSKSGAYSIAPTSNNSWMMWVALIAAVLIFIFFLAKKNEGKFTGFLGWLYEFLSFDKMIAEGLIKITYVFLAIWITLDSFTFIGVSFPIFLLTLVGGNVIIRVLYELSVVILKICRNTAEINKKLTKRDE